MRCERCIFALPALIIRFFSSHPARLEYSNLHSNYSQFLRRVSCRLFCFVCLIVCSLVVLLLYVACPFAYHHHRHESSLLGYHYHHRVAYLLLRFYKDNNCNRDSVNVDFPTPSPRRCHRIVTTTAATVE